MLDKLKNDFNFHNYIRYFYPYFLDKETEAQEKMKISSLYMKHMQQTAKRI